MDKKILEEAVADAKVLKETAIENAKNSLVEALSPKIKEFVDTQLGEQETVFEIEDELPIEEPAEEEEEMEESGMYEAKDEDNEEEEIEETVEITQEDLKQAFSEVLGDVQQEAAVTKSFGEPEDPTPKLAGGKQQTGIADEKTGENQWAEEEPPTSEDWTVKEAAYKAKIKKIYEAYQAAVNENKEYKKAVNVLRRNLQEVAVFNSKLVHTNKLLQSTKNLSSKQRVAVIEAFDKADSMREVQLVYNSLSESLKIAGVLGESRNNVKGAKASRFTSQSGASKLLKESNELSDTARRWQVLSDLVD